MDEVKINLPAGLEMEMIRQSTNSPDSLTSENKKGKSRVWRSACIECDKDFVVFVASYFILAGLLFFFGAGLWTAETCEQSNLYQSLMLLVLGVILPSPRLRN